VSLTYWLKAAAAQKGRPQQHRCLTCWHTFRSAQELSKHTAGDRVQSNEQRRKGVA
jgi:hypothetical protein